MKKAGWSEAEFKVVRLEWEFEALSPEDRSRRRLEFAVRMLKANGGSFTLSWNRSTPEPLEQLRIAVEEVAAGEPHLFFPRSSRGPSEARAYSADSRRRILGLATAAVMRLHHNIGATKKDAIAFVSQLLFSNGYTSSNGAFTGQGDGLMKECDAAAAGKAQFQEHYAFAMSYELPPKDEPWMDEGVYRLLHALELLCQEWRLLPQRPTGNPRI
jgi:HAMP domain-containing protein